MQCARQRVAACVGECCPDEPLSSAMAGAKEVSQQPICTLIWVDNYSLYENTDRSCYPYRAPNRMLW